MPLDDVSGFLQTSSETRLMECSSMSTWLLRLKNVILAEDVVETLQRFLLERHPSRPSGDFPAPGKTRTQDASRASGHPPGRNTSSVATENDR